MKSISHQFFLFLLFAVPTNSTAQDVIVKKDGSTILSKVLEVSETQISYKKFKNQNGPTYKMNITDIQCINYENGEQDKFDETEVNIQPSQISGGTAKPANNNKQIIDSYNNNGASFIIEERKEKKTTNWIGMLGIDNNSVISSDVLEITIVQRNSCLLNGTWSHVWPFNGHFYLLLTNKSNYTIYIDLANTFRVCNDGSYKTYYDSDQLTVSHGSGGGVGLNVGSVANVMGINGPLGTIANGVSVSAGKNNGSARTYIKQRILAIPPKGKTVLEQCEWEHVKGAALWKEENCVYKSYCEGFNYSPLQISVKKGQLIEYTFDNSPRKYLYTLTYSQKEDFSNWEALTLNVYIKTLLGGVDIYKTLIERVRRHVANDNEKVILIGGTLF